MSVMSVTGSEQIHSQEFNDQTQSFVFILVQFVSGKEMRIGAIVEQQM